MDAREHLKLWTRPDCYIGAEWPEYYVVIGQHRDSDRVTRSNFRVAKKQLEAIEAKYPEWINPTDGDTAMLVNPYESHWAVGHVEWLGVHKDSPQELLDAAGEIVCSIADYPILDESDWSELEYEETVTYWENMSIRERLYYTDKAGLSCFAVRHNIGEIQSDRLWEYVSAEN